MRGAVMMMKRARCILFDLDGTLVDSLPDIALAVNRMRESFALPPLPEATISGLVGSGIATLVRRATAGEKVEPDTALRRTRDFYQAHPVEKSRAYPGVPEGLRRLRECGFRLGVVTNKPREIAEAVLCKLDLMATLEAVVGDDGRHELKPAPDGCLRLLTQFDAVPEESWMVGDHWTDLEAGRRAGMRRALARWGVGDPREETWDFAAADFRTLTAYLEQTLQEEGRTA